MISQRERSFYPCAASAGGEGGALAACRAGLRAQLDMHRLQSWWEVSVPGPHLLGFAGTRASVRACVRARVCVKLPECFSFAARIEGSGNIATSRKPPLMYRPCHRRLSSVETFIWSFSLCIVRFVHFKTSYPRSNFRPLLRLLIGLAGGRIGSRIWWSSVWTS